MLPGVVSAVSRQYGTDWIADAVKTWSSGKRSDWAVVSPAGSRVSPNRYFQEFFAERGGQHLIFHL